MTQQNDNKRKSIGELWPQWVSAIVGVGGLILATATFFVGRATAPSASPPAHSTVTTTTDTPATTGAPASPAAVKAGTQLAQYTANVSDGYYISINGTVPHPQSDQGFTTAYDLTYQNSAGDNDFGTQNQIAALNQQTASYQSCATDTVYTQTLNQIGVGTSFCYTGPNVIAAVTVTNAATDPTAYVALHVTVWQK